MELEERGEGAVVPRSPNLPTAVPLDHNLTMKADKRGPSGHRFLKNRFFAKKPLKTLARKGTLVAVITPLLASCQIAVAAHHGFPQSA